MYGAHLGEPQARWKIFKELMYMLNICGSPNVPHIVDALWEWTWWLKNRFDETEHTIFFSFF